MSGLGTILIIIPIALIVAVVLVIVGIRAPEAKDPSQERLAEFSVREEPISLEEIELAQACPQRVILPMLNSIGRVASRFTPQATLESTKRKMEMAGNPMRMDPSVFLVMRIVMAVVLGGSLILVFLISR